MALLDKAYKQRMVGALVLVALAVIFLPMLFSRQDEQRQIQVDAPTAPQVPVMPQVQVAGPLSSARAAGHSRRACPGRAGRGGCAATGSGRGTAGGRQARCRAQAASGHPRTNGGASASQTRYHAKTCRWQWFANQLVGAVGQSVQPCQCR